jgi:hypothetical protein
MLLTRAADGDEQMDAVLAALAERDRRDLAALMGWYMSYRCGPGRWRPGNAACRLPAACLGATAPASREPATATTTCNRPPLPPRRFSNPSGHYELALSSPLQRFLALRLKDVAATCPEGHLWANIVHDMFSTTARTPGSFGPPEAWHGGVPSAGTLAMDYVQLEPPPPGCTPVADSELAAFAVERLGAPVYAVQALLEEAAARGQPWPEEVEEAAAGEQAAGDDAGRCRGSGSQLPAPGRGSGLVQGGGGGGGGAATASAAAVAAGGCALVAQADFEREADMVAALRREWRSSWTVRCRQVGGAEGSRCALQPDARRCLAGPRQPAEVLRPAAGAGAAAAAVPGGAAPRGGGGGAVGGAGGPGPAVDPGGGAAGGRHGARAAP